MLKNTSFEWTIKASSYYIFIKEFITYMVLNFKHVKIVKILTLITSSKNPISEDRISVENQLYQILHED